MQARNVQFARCTPAGGGRNVVRNRPAGPRHVHDGASDGWVAGLSAGRDGSQRRQAGLRPAGGRDSVRLLEEGTRLASKRRARRGRHAVLPLPGGHDSNSSAHPVNAANRGRPWLRSRPRPRAERGPLPTFAYAARLTWLGTPVGGPGHASEPAGACLVSARRNGVARETTTLAGLPWTSATSVNAAHTSCTCLAATRSMLVPSTPPYCATSTESFAEPATPNELSSAAETIASSAAASANPRTTPTAGDAVSSST
jgi:hypothetical protein